MAPVISGVAAPATLCIGGAAVPLSEHILYSCAVPVLCTVQNLTSAKVETPSSGISILYQGIQVSQ